MAINICENCGKTFKYPPTRYIDKTFCTRTCLKLYLKKRRNPVRIIITENHPTIRAILRYNKVKHITYRDNLIIIPQSAWDRDVSIAQIKNYKAKHQEQEITKKKLEEIIEMSRKWHEKYTM